MGVIYAEDDLSILRELTSDNPIQQAALTGIETNMQLKSDELAQTIELTIASKMTEAIDIVRRNEGKAYMDRIRSDMRAFNDREALYLEERKGDFKANRAIVATMVLMEIIVFSILAIATALFLNRNLFQPLSLLLSSTQRMELGEKLDVTDILAKDEMGRLLSSFHKMHQKVYARTETLTHQAHYDELTGLKNRSELLDDMEAMLTGLDDSTGKVAVLYMDLDAFKEINDTLGHDCGDLVLRETATRIRRSVRSEDTVYRLGGDEFLVAVGNIDSVSAVTNIARKISLAFDTDFVVNGQSLDVKPSIGMAIAPDDTSSTNDILTFSDVAMYAAKRDKTERYRFFDRAMLKRASDQCHFSPA